eukprot:TRINITY_DN1260_c0_g1_i2.p3 TRINITY_DN1260_c0_g1~~TRINITY_DN1260_c0_g1_i2.p3  ORF type:complete len:135 (-),score=14.99 TRINITY_DN1260_c0_g1_i2:1056-1460(-)
MPRTHVIAVDGGAASDAAFKFANESLPKDDKFVVVHSRSGRERITRPGNFKTNDVEAYAEEVTIFAKYKELCKESQRNCVFRDMAEFRGGTGAGSTHATDVGHKICQLAHGVNAASVIVGKPSRCRIRHLAQSL